MKAEWTLEDMEKEFYIYITRVGRPDALYSLMEIKLSVEHCQMILDNFIGNFKNTLEAVTVPFHVGLFTASMSQVKLTEKLLNKARNKGCRTSFDVALYLMNNKSYRVGIEAVIPSFQKLEDHGILSPQFETIYKLAAIRFYGCLEELSKEVLKFLITRNVSCLVTLATKVIRIGKSKCDTLKARIEQDQRELSLSFDQAYDEHILNKGYSLEQYSKIFQEILSVSFTLSCFEDIKRLEASRHLFVHTNSVIDQKYIDKTGCSQPCGDVLRLPASSMYTWQASLVTYVQELFSKIGEVHP